MDRIFISYRRDGGEYLAGRIYDHLIANGYSVFYDIESLRTGKFNEQLYKKIAESEYVIIILPPKGLDRCVNPDDWFRLEIAKALEMRKIIIPIMMPGFTFPDNLPLDIADIVNYQGFVANNSMFKDQMQRLMKMMSDSHHETTPAKSSSKDAVITVGIAVCIVILCIFSFFVIKGMLSDDNVENTTPENKETTEVMATYSATSCLGSFAGTTYQAENAFDSDLNTAWVEGVDGDGVGECVTVSFDAAVSIKSVGIVNGYAKSRTSYYDNNRAKRISVKIESSLGTTEKSFDLEDLYEKNYIFDLEEIVENVSKVSICIDSGVYKGDKYSDTAIADIFLYDENGKVIVFKQE